jgi:hypothetical protein
MCRRRNGPFGGGRPNQHLEMSGFAVMKSSHYRGHGGPV